MINTIIFRLFLIPSFHPSNLNTYSDVKTSPVTANAHHSLTFPFCSTGDSASSAPPSSNTARSAEVKSYSPYTTRNRMLSSRPAHPTRNHPRQRHGHRSRRPRRSTKPGHPHRRRTEMCFLSKRDTRICHNAKALTVIDVFFDALGKYGDYIVI